MLKIPKVKSKRFGLCFSSVNFCFNLGITLQVESLSQQLKMLNYSELSSFW